MTSRRTALSCRHCGAPGHLYLGGRLCPRHAPGGPDGEVMRPFPENATWGDLRRYVEFCEDIPDDRPVGCAWHPLEDEVAVGLTETLDR